MRRKLLSDDQPNFAVCVVEEVLHHVLELIEVGLRMMLLADEEIDQHAEKHRPDVDLRSLPELHQPLQRLPKIVPLGHVHASHAKFPLLVSYSRGLLIHH